METASDCWIFPSLGTCWSLPCCRACYKASSTCVPFWLTQCTGLMCCTGMWHFSNFCLTYIWFSGAPYPEGSTGPSDALQVLDTTVWLPRQPRRSFFLKCRDIINKINTTWTANSYGWINIFCLLNVLQKISALEMNLALSEYAGGSLSCLQQHQLPGKTCFLDLFRLICLTSPPPAVKEGKLACRLGNSCDVPRYDLPKHFQLLHNFNVL